jgi:hypothetical protein
MGRTLSLKATSPLSPPRRWSRVVKELVKNPPDLAELVEPLLFAAVFGLTPSRYPSGEINRAGAISRCGDEMTRVMLYEAAHIMLVRLAKWSWLKAWAIKIARTHAG